LTWTLAPGQKSQIAKRAINVLARLVSK
jgi:hypothetical protein